MKNWREIVEKNLGKTAANYVYKHAFMETEPSLKIVFFDEGLYTAALRDKNTLEKLFHGVTITCRNYART